MADNRKLSALPQAAALEAADRMCYVAKESGRNRIAAEELRGASPRVRRKAASVAASGVSSHHR